MSNNKLKVAHFKEVGWYASSRRRIDFENKIVFSEIVYVFVI